MLPWSSSIARRPLLRLGSRRPAPCARAAASPATRGGCLALILLLSVGPGAGAARAELPAGTLIWSKGVQGDPSSRKIYRATLPAMSDVVALTSGEDVGGQISPDGKMVAYAKAKLAGGTDYHSFGMWSVYIVSIDGIGSGAEEREIDEDGYWPSWGADSSLYYSKADGKHTRIIRATFDSAGNVSGTEEVLSTAQAFPAIPEINECFVAPDGSWFAGRTRGNPSVVGVGAYSVDPPVWHLMGTTGGAGCMPYVAPDGSWGFHAGSSTGIRWGHAPHVADRQENQQLIPPLGQGYTCYHPGISTDGQWVMTGQSKDPDQNAGAWDIYIYKLDPQQMTVDAGQELVSGGFNGWPHLWIEAAAPPLTDSGAVSPPRDGGSPGDLARADGPADGDGPARPEAAAGPRRTLSGGCALAGDPADPGWSLPALILALTCGRIRSSSRRLRRSARRIAPPAARGAWIASKEDLRVVRSSIDARMNRDYVPPPDG